MIVTYNSERKLVRAGRLPRYLNSRSEHEKQHENATNAKTNLRQVQRARISWQEGAFRVIPASDLDRVACGEHEIESQEDLGTLVLHIRLVYISTIHSTLISAVMPAALLTTIFGGDCDPAFSSSPIFMPIFRKCCTASRPVSDVTANPAGTEISRSTVAVY